MVHYGCLRRKKGFESRHFGNRVYNGCHRLTSVHMGRKYTNLTVNHQKYASMRIQRKCEFCGKTFAIRSGNQRYCSESCAESAKIAKKKRRTDFINAVEPLIDLQHQEYFSFSQAAILMGCTRQYIYKLVAQGRLPASRLSNRMSIVRRKDIEKLLSANPYERIIPVIRK